MFEAPQRYSIIEKIDSGGMATVFHGIDTTLNRPVALKIIHPHLMENPDAIKRFTNEAFAIASLSHENVVKLFDYGEKGGSRFLVMEYIEGKNLLNYLQTYSKFPNLVLLEIALQLFSGLSAAHAKGICHRDIKPTNIMIDKSGTLKIMDFGIAHLLDSESMTMTGTLIGSPQYISPEQSEGKRVTVHTDIFSAGALLYQCATGVLPFTGENPHAIMYAILNSIHTPADDFDSRVLSTLARIIDRCLVKPVAQRATIEECIATIESFFQVNQIPHGKNRLASFCSNPQAVKIQENVEIYSFLCKQAHSAYKSRKLVVALRALSTADLFLPLQGANARLQTLITTLFYWRKIGVFAGSILLVFTGGVVVLPPFIKYLQATHVGVSPRNAPHKPSASKAQGTAVRARAQDSIAGVLLGSPRKKIHKENQIIESVLLAQSLGSPSLQASGIDQKGYVVFKTRPPFARVYIDGKAYGQTPLDVIELNQGVHTFEIRKDMHQPIIEKFSLAAAETLTVSKNLAKEEQSDSSITFQDH